MTIATVARPRVGSTSTHALWALVRIEARRMLRHPAPWLGLLLSVWFGVGVFEESWASAHYSGLVSAFTPLLLGVSVASASAFGRERTPVADDAPLGADLRSVARLLGGLSLVGLVALVVTVGALVLRMRGGLTLGDEPGRTAHAYYTLPELLQPVLLAAFAVALGAAAVHLLRHWLVASVVLFVYWFLVGATYWVFNGAVLRWLTPMLVQPVPVDVGPVSTDPTTFPASWLLSAPGEFQDHWVRLVVSPALAGWHDVYLVALTLLAVAVAVPGRLRRAAAAGGAVLGVLAVLLQYAVTP
jgi:hypothetical protein